METPAWSHALRAAGNGAAHLAPASIDLRPASTTVIVAIIYQTATAAEPR